MTFTKQDAVEYIHAVLVDLECLRNGETFDRHQIQSMEDLLEVVIKFIEKE